MKIYLFSIILMASFVSGFASDTTLSLRDKSDMLLKQWVDVLLDYQQQHGNPNLNGGILCPACARVHGRCGDAVLPLMYMADHTGEPKYLESAMQLMKWMDNVHRWDGSWMNDVHVSDWNGTTAFQAIALYEAIHHHGHLLNDSVSTVWKGKLLQAAQFIYDTPFIYSRRREGMRNMNVNYSASAPYVLYVVGKMHNRPDFIIKAKETADDVKAFFTENETFLFGEGPEIYKKTINGCFPVDLLYNVEESLPNLAYYAQLVDDKELLSLVGKSMRTHLEFMLPDGAWDNSWGTRSFKWCYWGGRTSDGFMGGYHCLAKTYPEFITALERNVDLLTKATEGGLLYGGMHNKRNGVEACIHHTFGHAKALASYLNQDDVAVVSKPLPRDAASGVKMFKDIHTWLVAEGDWRATITGFDAEYKVKGTHPMGGVLSMLWHKQAGPLFAASMNRYTMIEAPNMQSNAQRYFMPGTPRVELVANGSMYSNLDDLNTKITYRKKGKEHLFDVTTHLVDFNQKPFGNMAHPVEITYIFSDKSLIIKADFPDDMLKADPKLILPLIAAPEETVDVTTNQVTLKKTKGSLMMVTDQIISTAASNNGRIFNPVPGFSFVPIRISPDVKGKVMVTILFN
ncbi:MAG: hypothetical protein ACRCSQ_01575 [Bacteroidales bacterium]